MATYSNLKFITGVAGEDLTDKQSRLVKFDGDSFTVCGEGDPAFGVVFSGSRNGGHTTVTYRGNLVVEAGGTFSAGESLQSDPQGRVVTHTGSNPIIGVALSDGVVGQKVQVQFIGLSGNGESTTVLPNPTNGPTDVTITEPVADRIVYDIRHVYGSTTAPVPVIVTAAEAGAPISARLRREDDSVHVDWTEIGTATGSEQTLTIASPKSGDWLTLDVAYGAGLIRTQTAKVGVGHKAAIWAQSEHQRWYVASQHDADDRPVWGAANLEVTHPNYISSGSLPFLLDAVTPTSRRIVDPATADSTPLALCSLASALYEVDPDAKWSIVFQTKGASSPLDVVNDLDNLRRNWADDLVIHNAGTFNGTVMPSLVLFPWMTAGSSFGNDFPTAIGIFLTGRDLSGDLVASGTVVSVPDSTGGTIRYDHTLRELYGDDVKFILSGPHRFEQATTDSGVEVFFNSQSITQTTINDQFTATKTRARRKMQPLIDTPAYAGRFLPLGASPINYRNGDSDGLGGWEDPIHPGQRTIGDPTGLSRFAYMHGHIWGQAMGLSNWDVPVIEPGSVTWTPSLITIAPPAGKVYTTERIEEGVRGGPPAGSGTTGVGETRDWWTEVFGFEVNRLPCSDVTINGSGEIELRPTHAPTFSINDKLRFGMGGATGNLRKDDVQALTYKDFPVIDVGWTAQVAEGVAMPYLSVTPVVDWETVFANPLPLPTDTADGFIIGATTKFEDINFDEQRLGTSQLGSKASAEAIVWNDSGQTAGITTLMGTRVGFDVGIRKETGNIRMQMRDSAGTQFLGLDAPGTSIGLDTYTKIRVDADISDPANGKVWIFINDALTYSTTGLTTSGAFNPEQKLSLFWGDLTGRALYAVFWRDCSGDGTRLATEDAYRVIAGPASLANAHDWLVGPAVT